MILKFELKFLKPPSEERCKYSAEMILKFELCKICNSVCRCNDKMNQWYTFLVGVEQQQKMYTIIAM